MNYDYLFDSAQEINPISKEIVKEYHKKMDQLITSINSKMLERKDLDQLIGTDNGEMMKDNHANHARFVYSIIHKPNPEVLVNTILWVFKAYRSHGFSVNYWPAQLNAWLTVLKEQMTKEGFEQMEPLYNWMLTNIFNFAQISNEKLEPHKIQH